LGWSLTTLKEKLIKIGAKVVSHGRYVAFQVAELAISRDLFADTLRMIAELRLSPLASMGQGVCVSCVQAKRREKRVQLTSNFATARVGKPGEVGRLRSCVPAELSDVAAPC
jgi:hypothetical protein